MRVMLDIHLRTCFETMDSVTKYRNQNLMNIKTLDLNERVLHKSQNKLNQNKLFIY